MPIVVKESVKVERGSSAALFHEPPHQFGEPEVFFRGSKATLVFELEMPKGFLDGSVEDRKLRWVMDRKNFRNEIQVDAFYLVATLVIENCTQPLFNALRVVNEES